MQCEFKIVKLKQVLPPGIYPKREHNVRYFYHRTDGCYYMYDEKGCEFNLTTDGNIISVDRELIIGSESLSDDTLIQIGLRADYTHPSSGICNPCCNHHPTYIKAWTYLKDLLDVMESGGISRDNYKVSLTPAPYEGGIVGCSGSAIVPDEDSDGFRFTFEAGSIVQLFARANEGYKFVAWKEYRSNEIISIDPNWRFTIKRDMELLGVFEKTSPITNKYNVSLDVEPTNGGTVNGSGTYDENSEVTIVATANENYDFVKWIDASDPDHVFSSNATHKFNVTKDITLKAVFIHKQISVQVKCVEGGLVGFDGEANSTSETKTINKGEQVTIFAKPDEGYSFSRWTKNESEVSREASYTFTPSSNSMYVAEFVKNDVNHNITIQTETNNTTKGAVSFDGSDITKITDVKSVAEGSNVTVYAKPAEGYVFDGWYKNDSKVSSLETYEIQNVTEEATYIAKFEIKKFNLNIIGDPDQSAYITVNINGIDKVKNVKSFNEEIDINSEITITTLEYNIIVDKDEEGNNNIIPREKYRFISFNNANDDSELSRELSYNFTLTENTSIKIKTEYVCEYTITSMQYSGEYKGKVSFDPDNITLENDVKYFVKGSNVTIYAKADQGFIFEGWYTDLSTKVSNSSIYTTTVLTPQKFIAKFIYEPAEDYLNVDPTEIVFEAEGGTKQINISSNVGWTIS